MLISTVPVAFLGFNVYEKTWENARREVMEKHLLLAQNLAEPLRIYMHDQMQGLQMLANNVQTLNAAGLVKHQQQIQMALQTNQDFRDITMLSPSGALLAQQARAGIAKHSGLTDYSALPVVHSLLDGKTDVISGVQHSLLDSAPTVIVAHARRDAEGTLLFILLAEIDMLPIEQIRRHVKFGRRGHCAIVDQNGKVIAHPNPAWMQEIKDLSHLSIIKNMMQGHTGVVEFYSPFVKQTMVAGYAAVPELGWGIMVPQPKSEVAATVNSMLSSFIAWSIFGFIAAITAACLLTRWITRPINQLAQNAWQLSNNQTQTLEPIPANSPREVQQLATSINNLFSSLCRSNNEINRINQSLQHQIDKATADLIKVNRKLESQATSDHLTMISNRRHFESTVNSILNNPDNSMIGIMLVDIDNFKTINDQYGHTAGDYVLTNVAELLRNATRPGDIVARYGGDEFVAEFRCDETRLKKRAEDLRQTVESYPFEWQGQNIQVTLSIGLICHKLNQVSSLDELMRAADDAMYKSKQAGRNRVSLLAS